MRISLNGICLLAIVSIAFWAMPTFAERLNLPERKSPRPETTDGIPHIQIDVDAVPELSAELLQRVSKMTGVDLRRTIVGRSGSTGFWLSDDMKLARPGAIVRGREFAHLHPDGSLHASLPPQVAAKAIKAGWAVYHPWADKRKGLEGFVMIYTPTTTKEMDVVLQLIIESYEFITGKVFDSTAG